jgi:hypothetical protein
MPGKSAGFLLIAAPTIILGLIFASGMKSAMLNPSANPNRHAAAPRGKQTARPAAKRGVATPHEKFATFLSGEGFQSVLLLENFRGDAPITVTPALIVSVGEVPLDPVTLPPHSAATVDIDAALRAHGFADTRGSVVVHYAFDSYGAVEAVVEATDEIRHLYLNSFAQSPEEDWTGTAFDGMVWAPEEGTEGFVSITNTSSEARVVHATFLVDDRVEQQPGMEIGPRQTRFLPIEDLVARSRKNGAGMHLEFAEYPGDILLEGQLFNPRTGFTKHLHFMDKSLGFGTGTLRTHFLLLGQQAAEDGFPAGISFRSVAAVRNIDTSPVQVTPTVKFLQGGTVQTVTLSPVVLGTHESRIIDFKEQQEAGHLPRDLHHGTLELVPEKDRVSIVGEFFAFRERTGGYVVGPSLTSYPTRSLSSVWRIDGTFQTTIVVENTASEEDQVSLKLFSGQGAYIKSFAVPAGGLLKVNVKELQQDKVPDNDGHTLTGSSGLVMLTGSHNARSRLSYDKILHDADQAGYIGYPPSGCGDYLIDLSLSVDFSSGQNPFLVMGDYYWSQSGETQDRAQGTSSSDPGHLQIGSDDSGDTATIYPDSQSHLVTLTSPPVIPITCAACSNSGARSASSDVTVPAVPTVTFDSFTPNPIVGGSTASLHITVNPSANITLTISNSGTGTATFGSSGKTTIQIPETTVVNILGGTESNGGADLTLTASYAGSILATQLFSVTTGACTATYASHGGDGLQNCPSQVNVFDTYSMKEYCSACQFACTPVNYDSTFTPSSCNGVSIGVQGAGNNGLITTLTGNFAATDCAFHYVQITTTVTDTNGVKTPYTGGAIGLKCNKFPNGSPCP